ncbi:MAG: translation initiation factor IF-2 [Microgenomates group bacterium]
MALQKKPPVVTIMGHIDHGKTSLLDFIRKTKLATKEVGEITQSIGAYQIKSGEEKITFIDTPGHEAFREMRSRGARVADLVVLVVAANDGVMPQTEESIKIIKEAKVPFLVALNKIDLPEAAPEKVKRQLAEKGVFVEGHGGTTVALPVSAKTGEGIDQLLEMILLMAEMEGLQADPEGDLEAVVIESKADKLCGPLVNLIIRNGSLKKGDRIQAAGIVAKVKMLRDEWGRSKQVAFPADPVQVLGFPSLPPVGSLVTSITSETLAAGGESTLGFSPVSQLREKSQGEKGVLKIILKTDVAGSLEAIYNCLPEGVEVFSKEVGEITEGDVLLAKTVGAEIYGFNLSLSPGIKKLAETEKVRIATYNIIYDLLKELSERILRQQTPERRIIGRAKILAVFEIKGEKVAGGRVLEGKINKGNPILLKRGEEEIAETKIVSLKEQKQDINEAGAGSEFGAIFADKLDFQAGDVLISYSLN